MECSLNKQFYFIVAKSSLFSVKGREFFKNIF